MIYWAIGGLVCSFLLSLISIRFKPFNDFVATIASWLSIVSFLILAYVSDSIVKYRSDLKRKKDIPFYCNKFKHHILDIETLLPIFDKNIVEISNCVSAVEGDITNIKSFLIRRELSTANELQNAVIKYQQLKSKVNAESVLEIVYRLISELEGLSREGKEP